MLIAFLSINRWWRPVATTQTFSMSAPQHRKYGVIAIPTEERRCGINSPSGRRDTSILKVFRFLKLSINTFLEKYHVNFCGYLQEYLGKHFKISDMKLRIKVNQHFYIYFLYTYESSMWRSLSSRHANPYPTRQNFIRASRGIHPTTRNAGTQESSA